MTHSGTLIMYVRFICSCPYLTTHITSAIPIVGAILYVFTMSSLLRTTFTDPGVIPRALQDEAAYIEKQIGNFLDHELIIGNTAKKMSMTINPVHF